LVPGGSAGGGGGRRYEARKYVSKKRANQGRRKRSKRGRAFLRGEMDAGGGDRGGLKRIWSSNSCGTKKKKEKN